MGDFTRKFKCNHYFIHKGDSRPIPRNWNVWPEMQCNFFFTLTFHTAKKGNPFHRRYKELIIFITTYSLLHSPPCSFLHILFLEAASENSFPADSFKKYKIKANPKMSILMYFKIQSDQTRITQNFLKSQIFDLFTKSSSGHKIENLSF